MMTRVTSMVAVLKVAFGLYLWPPEPGKWQRTLSSSENVFVVSRDMASNTSLLISVSCKDVRPGSSVRADWLLRRVNCDMEPSYTQPKPSITWKDAAQMMDKYLGPSAEQYVRYNKQIRIVCNTTDDVSPSAIWTWEQGIYELIVRITPEGTATHRQNKSVSVLALDSSGFLSPRDSPFLWVEFMAFSLHGILFLGFAFVAWPVLFNNKLQMLLGVTILVGTTRALMAHNMLSDLNWKGTLDVPLLLTCSLLYWIYTSFLTILTLLFTSGYYITRETISSTEMFFYTGLVLVVSLQGYAAEVIALFMDVDSMAKIPGLIHLADTYTVLGFCTILILIINCIRTVGNICLNAEKYECTLKQGLSVLIASNIASICCIFAYWITPDVDIVASCQDKRSELYHDAWWKQIANTTQLAIMALIWFCAFKRSSESTEANDKIFEKEPVCCEHVQDIVKTPLPEGGIAVVVDKVPNKVEVVKESIETCVKDDDKMLVV